MLRGRRIFRVLLNETQSQSEIVTDTPNIKELGISENKARQATGCGVNRRVTESLGLRNGRETRKQAVVAMLLREKVKGEFCFTHS
jgi:hypothetical protein